MQTQPSGQLRIVKSMFTSWAFTSCVSLIMFVSLSSLLSFFICKMRLRVLPLPAFEGFEEESKKTNAGISLVVRWLEFYPFKAIGLGSIPGGGIKIP